MISLAVAVAGAVTIAVICLAVGRMSAGPAAPSFDPNAAPSKPPAGPLSPEFVVDVHAAAGEPGIPPARMLNRRTGSTSYFEPDVDVVAVKEENRKLQERLAEAEASLKKQLEQTPAPAAATPSASSAPAATALITAPLTQLHSRRAFDEKLAGICDSQASGEADDAAVILMEVDQLLQITAKHGAPAGEFVLSRLAGVVRDTVGSEGFAARYGDDEFGVILPQVSVNRSKIIAERIRKNCDASHDYMGSQIKTSVSLGVTECSESRDLTLAGLDRALHAAKEAGCNKTFLCCGAELSQVEIAALTHSDINELPTEAERKSEWFDRRNGRRKGYEAMQWLAPYEPGRPIRRESFREVRCRDISLGGFSYLLLEKPDYDEVVVALGSYPNMTYVRAKVVHVAKDTPTPDTYLVGCRFAERLAPQPQQPAPPQPQPIA